MSVIKWQSLVRFWNLGEEYLLQTANWLCTVKILEPTNYGTWQQSHTQKHTLAWLSALTDMWMVTSQSKKGNRKAAGASSKKRGMTLFEIVRPRTLNNVLEIGLSEAELALPTV